MPDDENRPDTLPLPLDGPGSFDWWTNQLDWAKELRNSKLDGWRRNIKAYLDTRLFGVEEIRRPIENVRPNIEFEKTEQKRAQLFFQVPHVALQALQPGLEDAVHVFQAVINHKLGPHGVNVKATMREMIFDLLCPSGIGACKVGYESYEDGTVPMVVDRQPDPNFVQPVGSVLGLSEAPLVDVVEQVPNVVAERYYVDRISPAKLLVPADFDRSDYDEAPWLAHEFFGEPAELIKLGWITEEDKNKTQQDDQRLVELEKQTRSSQQGVKCREVWYYPSRVDASVVNPDRVRRLVFIDGRQAPVVHEDSPYQLFEAGRLTQGMRGFPIKVLTLRYVSDTPYPPSDCAATGRLSDELSEGRTQMVKQRRRAIPLRAVDKGRVDPDDLEKIKRGDISEIIALDGNPAEILFELARAAYPRENFTFDEIVHADIDRMWALGANQSGVREKTSRTATELSLMQRATDTRLSAEQGLIVDFFLKVVEAVGSLLQLFADETDYVEIVGADGARRLEAWDKSKIQGRFAYSAKADSAKRPDVVYERELALTRYSQLVNDPYTNREQLVRETFEILGGDPARLVKTPEPPAPEKPKVSISIKGEDLDPMAPQYQNVVNLLIQAGVPADMAERREPAPSENERPPVERKALERVSSQDGRMGGLVQ